jgi:hypothetical protein
MRRSARRRPVHRLRAAKEDPARRDVFVAALRHIAAMSVREGRRRDQQRTGLRHDLFAQAAYDDRASNEIVVKLTRIDQDPATESEAITVDCGVTGGTAVENVDYRFGFNGSVVGLGRITFPPGVHEQAFSIYTVKSPGPNKTLQIGCSNPAGPAPAVTGQNPVAQITIVNTP